MRTQIYTDMNADRDKKSRIGLLYEKLSYELRGAAIEVRRNLGPGHKENIYQKAYAEELLSRNIHFEQEKPINIYSPKTGKLIGTYRPDFIVKDKIIVELKAIRSLPEQALETLYNYLRNSKCELGFLINFGSNRLYIKRIIYTNDRKPWLCVNPCSSPCLSVFKGYAWKFGDDVNTDVIYPGKYLPLTDSQEMKEHAFESVYPDFVKEFKKGDIIVAGEYFGCGSSREQAATCLKVLGVACIIAESFARIYYRNAINQGLPILECPGISKKVKEGDQLEVNLEKGLIKNLSTGESFKANPLPPFILEILRDGGLIPHLKKE
ncbi:GxxExxY protein [candidate division WOR-3 bacterium]|nr:GxxExxY protein [candidate division WOR-3 bacterium]